MSDSTQNRRLTPASSETLFTLLETLPGALFIIDDAATIIYANVSAQAFTGTTGEDVCGKPLWRGAPQLGSTLLYQAVQQTRQTRALTEVEYLSPVTGTWLHVQLSPTVGGLMVQVHQGKTAALREVPVSQGECLRLDDLYHGIVVLTPEGIILEINEVPLAHNQIRREEVIGRPLAEVRWWSFYPASQEQLRAAIARAGRGERVRFETVVHPSEDMDRHLDVTITPRMDADHHIAYLVVAGIDITARKRAEAELHALIDAIPQLVWTARPDGFFDSCNQRWRDCTGLSTEEAQGEGWLQCLHPEDRQRVRSLWQRAVQTGEGYAAELRRCQGMTGEYRWFLARAVPVRDGTGQIIKWFGTSTDIEEQKRTEQAVRESREELVVLMEMMPQLVWIARPDGFMEQSNQRTVAYLNVPLEQFKGDQWLQFVHPEDRDQTWTAWQTALRTGQSYEVECRLREGTTGTYRWFLARGIPSRDEQGCILRWFGTLTDIEEQKRTEQQLKESEQNWRVLAETVPHLVWAVRSDGRLEYANRHVSTYLGAFPEYILGDEWRQFVHPDDYARFQAARRHVLETGESYEGEYRLKELQTGRYRWFLGRFMAVRDETGQIVKRFGTATDIDEQKRIEEALRQSQESIRALIDSNSIGIVSVDAEEGVIVEANDTWLHMTGYIREEVRSRMLTRARITPPEHAPLFELTRQELTTRGQHTPFETEVVCKDGTHLPVLVGGVLFREHPRQMVVFVLDNSARKELEQRKDDFIGMASHELRNPLTILKLQTTLLHRQLAKQGTLDQAPALVSMEAQIKTTTWLVEELLDVSKIQAGSLEYVRETVDLDALLREIADTMQQNHPSHRILMRGEVQAHVFGDRDRLGQVFTNLLSNAIKYSPDAETVEIELSASAEAVTIRVRDHGLGIPHEQRDKIFERFYRVSSPKQRAISGLGMGLYIVSEIIQGHGGTITVDSDVGKGSTFTVTLPRRRDA